MSVRIAAVGVAFVLCVAPGTADEATSMGGGNLLKEAKAHQARAKALIADAVRTSEAAALAEASAELDRAAEGYRTYAKDEREPEAIRIRWAAAGLLECDRPLEALTLILDHPGSQNDDAVLHLWADALLALGDATEAGKAYERWIARADCGGFYRNWPGEPRIGYGTAIYPKRDPKSGCAHLAPELRARLETLQRLVGHPDNLPARNYESSPRDTY